MSDGATADGPRSGWARHQQQFRDTFVERADSHATRPMHFRWWTATEDGPSAGIQGVLNLPYLTNVAPGRMAGLGVLAVLVTVWLFVDTVPILVRVGVLVLAVALYLLRRGGPLAAHRPRAGHKYVALYPLLSTRRSPPALVFEVEPSAFGGSRNGEGDAIVVGRPVPNGHFCILHERVSVWPVRNPVRRMPGAPGR